MATQANGIKGKFLLSEGQTGGHLILVKHILGLGMGNVANTFRNLQNILRKFRMSSEKGLTLLGKS